MVGYWRIDEDSGASTADSTAAANHASVNGATWSVQDSPIEFQTPVYDTGVIVGSAYQLRGRIGINNFEVIGEQSDVPLDIILKPTEVTTPEQAYYPEDSTAQLIIVHTCPDFDKDREDVLIPIASGKIRGRGVYFMHGLIQLLLPEVSVESRLIFGRVFAICIGVALIYVVYSLANLLFNDSRLSIASAALVGLMPSVSNIISAVSTEGPALLAVGILLLSSANLAIRGYSLPRSLMFCVGVAACLCSKMTAIVSLPLSLIHI